MGEPRTEMQQRRGRRAFHAEIAVGRPGHHALEQAEHAAHALDPIKRCDKMHLRGAGIGKTDANAARHQGPHQTFRTVHPFHSRSRCLFGFPERSIIPDGFRQRVLGTLQLSPGTAFLTAAFENRALTASLLAKSPQLWTVSPRQTKLAGEEDEWGVW